MIIWLDAQLPPQLATWLRLEFQIEAKSLRDLGLRDATDRDIFMQARASNAVIISKDRDFVDLVQILGPPPKLVWLTCGNVTNARLRIVFCHAWAKVTALLEAGEPIVELGDISTTGA
jgi:predicted nuclease of predicted toxin-antitoxin system